MALVAPSPESTLALRKSHVRHLALAAHLARSRGQFRIYTDSDLRGFPTWCESRGPDPLVAEARGEIAQAAYFAFRLAAHDLTGIADQAENEKGLDNARRGLAAFGLGTT
jgi:hypothetical protein